MDATTNESDRRIILVLCDNAPFCQTECMEQQPDFLKRHTLLSSICLLVLMEVCGHVLWLGGVISDNNTGGEILYHYLPLAWVVLTIILMARKLL